MPSKGFALSVLPKSSGYAEDLKLRSNTVQKFIDPVLALRLSNRAYKMHREDVCSHEVVTVIGVDHLLRRNRWLR